MAEKKSGFDFSVSLCRVIGMLMVVACHVATAYDMSAIAQLLQVGVQLFLLISGYLYSNKKIGSPGSWLKNRFLRINIPCYIWVVLMFAVGAVFFGELSLGMLGLSAVSMQGYYHFLTFLPAIPVIRGTSHLWFITVLAISYLLMLVVKYREDKNQGKQEKQWFFGGLVLSVLLGFIGVRADYIWIFFAGYYLGRRKTDFNGRNYVLSTVAMVATLAARLLLKRYCDANGDNNLYLYVVIPLAYNAMAIWLFITIKMAYGKMALVQKMAQGKCGSVIRWLDGMSFYIYITHYAFSEEPLDVMHLTGSAPVNTLFMLLLTVVCSMGLKAASDWMIAKTRKN